MVHNVPEEISQSQKERLFYIDFKLRFLGLINRPDLIQRFGIKPAAATRDLALYKDLAPKNVIYDTRAKAYRESDSFKALFQYPGNQALVALLNGYGDNCISHNSAIIHAEALPPINTPELGILAEITKAIHQCYPLEIDYNSLESGNSRRVIIPHALVDNGLRWHVRAFDRKQYQFRDFVINRITRPRSQEGQVPTEQSQEADEQWNLFVEMHIVPHPSLPHPETIEMEYGIKSGRLKISTRAALVGYFLRRWGVDCSKKHKMNFPETHLWLQNHQDLESVANLTIAPGYNLN